MRRPQELAGNKVIAGASGQHIGRSLACLVDSPRVRECLRQFHRNRQWINERHLELCRIPAPTFFEAERAAWMAERLKNLGWEAKFDRAGNVVSWPEGRPEGSFVALTAHLDTVLAPRKSDEVRMEADGRMHGPGVSDNGAGLAALLAIAAAWKAAPPLDSSRRASLLLVANVGEEGEGNLSGMRFLCKQSPLGERIRSYVVLDGPGTDHITSRALASRRFEIIFNGPGGHSWSDQGNANAVHALSRAIYYFSEWQKEAVAGGARSSFNFGLIEGGASINSIPAQARAKLDLRSESQQHLELMCRLLQPAVERAAALENEGARGGKVTARIRELGARPGGALPQDCSLLPLLQAVDQHLGIRSYLDCASTDANIPLSMGLPAVSIGAGGQGGGAHTLAEWFDPEGRELGLQRILLTLCLLLGE